VSDALVPSTRPYLIRAIHEWCTDQGYTPYLAVMVDGQVQVPAEHVRENEIVLNISYDATSGLKMGNDWIEFKARFGGVPRDIYVPVDHVMAIYARENGQGMAFPLDLKDPAHDAPAQDPLVPVDDKVVKLVSVPSTDPSDEPPPEPSGPSNSSGSPASKSGGKPALKLVK
jgi:stringent starvation protein B